MVLQSKNIQLKVFIEGFDVTERCSGVSGISYQLNNPSYCNITLECPDMDFLVTQSDLEKIESFRKIADRSSSQFENKFKNYFLPKIVNKTYRSIIGGGGEKDKPLYQFGLFNHVIPVRANMRVFVKVDKVWYYVFTGVVNGRSFSLDENGRYSVTYQCIDVLWFLKRATKSTSLGVFEPSNQIEFFKNIIKTYTAKGKFDEDSIEKVPDSDGVFAIPDTTFKYTSFGIKERDLLEALVYIIYGDVDTKTLSGYGKETVNQNIESFGSIFNIERNIGASGLFSLHQIEVGIYGSGASNFEEELRSIYSSFQWRTKIGVTTMLNWDKVVGNIVRKEDLRDLAVLENRPIFDLPLDEIVDIIGRGTKQDGMFAVGGGGLKVLLPGSLNKEIYQVIVPLSLEFQGVEFENYQTMLQSLAWIVQRRSDMLYYSSPKGHIVVEFPMYDVDEFGENDWRSFTRNDWMGSFGDNENLDGLFSIARTAPQVGAYDLEIEGKRVLVDIPFDSQGAISEELVHKIGVRALDNDTGFGYIPADKRAALIKSRIILSLANRKSYAGSARLTFNPRLMLNRQVKFEEIGRAGLVLGQTMNVIPESAPDVSINLGYMRQRNVDGEYNIAFGTRLENLSINYGKFFNPEIFEEPKKE
jgi:hypothetical protein